ncbi:mRNA export protein mlo3 [Hypsizygus marmoreus]|uniref:mRNA export protein mlo3 n=1 Tax=Hypsizygus marmoreus TaxID=39966 RepID=A0A369K359_HYPMA|nr:mRNA export protein mlo3 [Hypsizygus marmoreus]
MDKSLDDIISSKPRNARRGSSHRGSARSQVLGKPTISPAARVRANAPVTNGPKVAATAAAASPADKIIVSNLPTDVNEVQIRELFTQTVGPLREVTLHYDSAGRSKGVAAVQFSRKGDGNKAFQQYNNRLIDGKKPMKIEIVVAPVQPSLVSRVAPAAGAATPANGTAPRTGAGARGGRRRGGKAGGRKERPAKSVADLDAEMEDYTASNAPAAAATA